MRSTSTWVAVAIAMTAVAAVAIVIAKFWNDLGASEISVAGWLALGFWHHCDPRARRRADGADVHQQQTRI